MTDKQGDVLYKIGKMCENLWKFVGNYQKLVKVAKVRPGRRMVQVNELLRFFMGTFCLFYNLIQHLTQNSKFCTKVNREKFYVFLIFMLPGLVLMYAEMFPKLKCIFLDKEDIWIKMQSIHASHTKETFKGGISTNNIQNLLLNNLNFWQMDEQTNRQSL